MENYGEFMVICQSFPPYGIHIVVIQVILPLRRNKNKTAQAILILLKASSLLLHFFTFYLCQNQKHVL